MKTAWQCSLGTATVAAAAAAYVALLANPGISFGAGFPAIGSNRSGRAAIVLAQADENVSPGQLNKYIAVYKAMQHNHSLTVEQAAASQGLTLQQFRDVEQRVERNDVARQTVRRALAHGAMHSTPSAPGGKQKTQH